MFRRSSVRLLEFFPQERAVPIAIEGLLGDGPLTRTRGRQRLSLWSAAQRSSRPSA